MSATTTPFKAAPRTPLTETCGIEVGDAGPPPLARLCIAASDVSSLLAASRRTSLVTSPPERGLASELLPLESEPRRTALLAVHPPATATAAAASCSAMSSSVSFGPLPTRSLAPSSLTPSDDGNLTVERPRSSARAAAAGDASPDRRTTLYDKAACCAFTRSRRAPMSPRARSQSSMLSPASSTRGGRSSCLIDAHADWLASKYRAGEPPPGGRAAMTVVNDLSMPTTAAGPGA